MKKKSKLSLRLKAYYTLVVCMIGLLSFGTVMAVMLLLSRFGLVKQLANSVIIALFLFTAVTIGLLSFFIGRRISTPMVKLSEASREIARGNFNISLPESSKLAEVKNTFRNFNAMARTLNSYSVTSNDFVTNVSHEFKTPLTAIEGYTMLLQNTSLSDTEREEYMDKILFNTHRLSTLVGNILMLSKIENQSIADQCSDFRMDEQLRQAVVSLEPVWSERNISFDVALDCVTFSGCESLLMRVWTNLIGNAVKFSEDGQVVGIRLRNQTECVVVTVTDHGCGMGPEVQERIFEKFYQGDISRKSLGNGLGLPLVKRIVELSEGLIEVDSKEGSGSTFRVILPK